MPTVTTDPQRLEALTSAYAGAIAARRNKTILGFLIFAAVLVASGWVAEVDLAKLFAKIGNFTSYIVRLAHLDSGALVLTDVGEWFWGLNHWLKLLAETLMIAYVGTIVGAVVGFVLCFPAARNLTRSALEMAVVRRFLEFCRTVPEIVTRSSSWWPSGSGRCPACSPSPSTPRARSASFSPRWSRTST